ncbi:MAG: hypothetical protein C3F07_08155 [Anaerolineales bacterium]|nr:MAG: hypothetical protein C3F07_08155 [Anaerolineales bacterium]
MKRFSIPFQILVITLIVSACGAPQSTPTIDPVDLQSTVAAAAFTVLAETQAAIPTATPLPPTATPTNTPAFTATLPPLPTLGATFTPSPVVSSNANDPCVNQVLPDSLTGKPIKIRIDNPVKATINLTVYLQSGNPQGVCGYRAYVLAAGDSLVINDLVEGCYTLWAWNPEPKDYFIVTNGTSCLDGSKSWTFDITPNGIKLR